MNRFAALETVDCNADINGALENIIHNIKISVQVILVIMT
jgi:hypothetical protein